MKQRIMAVGLVFLVGALYLKQWHSLVPQFENATFGDHVQHPVILLCFFGYLLCKTDKQRWMYSLNMALVGILVIGVKLFVLQTPYIVLEIMTVPTLMYLFYKYYFDWLMWMEIQFSELKQKMQHGIVPNQQLQERFERFTAVKEEQIERFNMQFFLYQEKELMEMNGCLAQYER